MSEKRVILHAADLDGYLTDGDKTNIGRMDELYSQVNTAAATLSNATDQEEIVRQKSTLIGLYDAMGKLMQEVTGAEKQIRVYSFETPRSVHGEVSRLIAKLRDVQTQNAEFVYYVQRAYELLFTLAYTDPDNHEKNHLIVKTPVSAPVQNYAVHKIPNIDSELTSCVMCVMLRGALLPSMILSKEIQEYSSAGYVTPFALFRIQRDDRRKERDMEYVLDLERSYFDPAMLDGKDLVFADPMNATGGSLVTIIQYLKKQGVRPRSIKFLNVISALKGTLRLVRALEDVHIYTLWMDPVLNDAAYILPGLGDAGDRLNGKDAEDMPRNIIQLVADYGTTISNLYRSQVRKIEETVLRL
ncbi:MAG: uracil phosphoribosyltransferase [Spirochaeta sp.]|nr:uracil phosphoribosyltransferase [Spirochaeta sp.]